MNELERIRAALADYRKAHDHEPLNYVPFEEYETRGLINQNAVRWLTDLLAVVTAAASLTGLGDFILRLDGYESNLLCPYCKGNYKVVYEDNPFVHSPDCPVVVLEAALARLTAEEGANDE